MKYSKYDVIIVGSGISGLYLANKLSVNKDFKDGILLVTKEDILSGSSYLAQGGMVSVIPEINPLDSIQSHISDTIKAGCGLNNLNTVKYVSENSFIAAQELINFGVRFDRNEKKSLNFTLEGAHSCPRILHANGDSTGRVIVETLAKCLEKQEGIDIYKNTLALEILVDMDNVCRGLVVYNWEQNSYEAVYSNNVILATGGIGQLYKRTTNPSTSTGDGIAIAYRAGAEVENMEFVQFHPTALYCKNKGSTPLISESVRGEGAKLVDLSGNYFAKNYDKKADLAPRDVVSRAIVSQMKINNDEYVNLDISQIGIEKFKKRFPTITRLCEENNVDINSGLIPVIPAAHYFMGGIKTDLNSMTSIKNLYAVGECASSGLHGANRLASNSLLECVVFSDKLAKDIIKSHIAPPKMHDEKVKNTIDKYNSTDFEYYAKNDDLSEIFDKLKNIMSEHSGIIRTDYGLKEGLREIISLEKKLDILPSYGSRIKYELENAICISKLIIKSALKRTKSIGAHYRADYTDNTEVKKETGLNENVELFS